MGGRTRGRAGCLICLTVARITGVSGCGRPARWRTAVRAAARSMGCWPGRSRRSSIYRAVGSGRPLPSQARAPRQLHRDGVRVASTLLRVALKHRIRLLGERFRPRPPKPPFPEISWEKNRIWIWDATHFTRAKRVAYAIVDVVTRYWIGYLLSSEQTHTQVQLLFARALEDQGLLCPDGLPLRDVDEDGPILVAWSDNGAEMTAIDTRQFMALMAIAQHHGRPGTRPTRRTLSRSSAI